MPTYWVPIHAPTGDEAEKIAAKLSEAGISEVGPAYGGRFHDLPQPGVYAKIDADDEGAAEARIREVVGEGLEVGPAGLARAE